ncbi:MAG: c-type cytochrome domain-containing protein [Bryobacteraceae bacterium]|nr:c-type cytochrome domain-containing protein [Bryobacteraceae bacterium]
MLKNTVGMFVVTVWSLAAAPSFNSDIRPILQKQCQGCHQPSSKASGLDVTSFEELRKGGRRGAAWSAGKPEASLLVRYVTGEVQPRMPLGQPALPPADIELLREWIRTGAADDSVETSSAMQPIVYLQPPVITALRFSPDGKSVAVSGNREILIHKADGTGITGRLAGKAERILSIAFSNDGKLLVAGGGTPAQFGEVQVWDIPGSKLLHSATLTTDTVFGASLAPDNSRIAVGSADNTVHVFETSTGKELYKIGNHENWVLATVFASDSKRFVSAGRDRAAKLIDAKSGAFLENVNLLRGELTAIARNPKKDVVVMGGEERYPYIYLLDRPRNMKIADDTTLVRKLERQDGAITALDWSPDGARIAVAGLSPSVNLYDPETGDRKATCKGHTAGIYTVAFSPDGKQLATGGFDGKVRIYNTSDCSLLHSFVPVPLSAGAAQSGGVQ